MKYLKQLLKKKRNNFRIISEIMAIITSPIGNMQITTTKKHLIGVELLANSKKPTLPKDLISKKVQSQILAYFKNSKHVFDLPIKVSGTAFQKKVWRELQKIPVGKTLTYGDLAKKLKTSPRAIGNACHANCTPIIIPCHRVVSKTGLGGFSGKTNGRFLNIKKFLLSHERGCHE